MAPFAHNEEGLHVMLPSMWQRTLAAVGTLLMLCAISSCTMFFPSRPLSDAIHIRNSAQSVDFMFCGTGTVDFGALSRGVFRGERDGLPLTPGVIEVEDGSPTSFSTLIALPEGSTHLAPLKPEEQLDFSFRDDGGVLHSGDFLLTEEILVGFEDGDWLSTDGTLSSDPCE
ncbi:MAG: hypothetical protein KIT89_09145 [Microcella sp.]|uniref:hypothetical protein n=1 Tax=Microcella sp. TaxID=1913979 RepID=UPI0024CDCF22|nr:hypothetical protein [Microcella sp.]UYN82876.1 MAG: hypothetical protein KIT89_09145 [Microcella sp.]